MAQRERCEGVHDKICQDTCIAYQNAFNLHCSICLHTQPLSYMQIETSNIKHLKCINQQPADTFHLCNSNNMQMRIKCAANSSAGNGLKGPQTLQPPTTPEAIPIYFL